LEKKIEPTAKTPTLDMVSSFTVIKRPDFDGASPTVSDKELGDKWGKSCPGINSNLGNYP
jgi:hypothetical protein